MREKAHFTPPAVLVPQLVEVPAPLEEKLRLAGQRLAVSDRDRHTNTRGTNLHLLVAEDLASLVHHLHFFAGIAVVLKVVDVGYRIKCNLLWINFWLWRFSVQ